MLALFSGVAHLILDARREIEVILTIGDGDAVDAAVGRHVWLLRILAVIEDGN